MSLGDSLVLLHSYAWRFYLIELLNFYYQTFQATTYNTRLCTGRRVLGENETHLIVSDSYPLFLLCHCCLSRGASGSKLKWKSH